LLGQHDAWRDARKARLVLAVQTAGVKELAPASAPASGRSLDETIDDVERQMILTINPGDHASKSLTARLARTVLGRDRVTDRPSTSSALAE